MMNNRYAPSLIYLEAHSVGLVLTRCDLGLAPHQQILLRNELSPVGKLAARKLQLDIARHIMSRTPDAARRTEGNDGVVVVHGCHGRMSVYVVPMRTCEIPVLSAFHVEGCVFHAQRIEDLFLHGFVISYAKLSGTVVEMRTDIARGGSHKVAVLEHFAEP